MLEKLIIFLDDIAIPQKAIRDLIENNLLNSLLDDIEKDKENIINTIGESIYLKLKNAISIKNIEKTTQKLENFNIFAITILNKKYPELLKNISNPPLILYYKGNIDLLTENLVAIVGTRRPTSYGREVTRKFARELVNAGVVTVSGLAYGLDMEVANASLEANGKTIAVLAGGLNKIYPAQNTNLAEDIVKNGGLLLSLHAPGYAPKQYSFLERNAIISGVSLGVVIIEAGEGSGTLNTAANAIEQGRELFIVPANILSPASFGSNRLIEEFPETFTISTNHILNTLNIQHKNSMSKSEIKQITQQEKLIIDALYEGELDADALQEKTNLNSKTLISLLTMMEINGLIKKLPGNLYSL